MTRCATYRADRKQTGLASLLLLCILAMVFAVSAGPAAAGTINGTVRFAGAVAEQNKLPVTVDHFVCGQDKDAEDLVLSPEQGIGNVVVSLDPPPAGAKWPLYLPVVQIDQQQCVFIPRIVIVPVGGTVEFLNSDHLLHNLHSDSAENPSFNRTQPRGRTIPIAFKKPEIIRIDCDLHPWMRAWVIVAAHPFYALTDERGEFVLDHVPPGEYTLQFWQERLGVVTENVTVTEQEAASVTVQMGR